MSPLRTVVLLLVMLCGVTFGAPTLAPTEAMEARVQTLEAKINDMVMSKAGNVQEKYVTAQAVR